MKMFYVLAAVLVAYGFAMSAASAEPFTFTATQTADPEVIAIPAQGGGQIAAVTLRSNGSTTWASGKTEEWTSECHNMSSPNQDFDSTGLCISTTKGSGDKLFVAVVCNSIGETPGNAACWGYFSGGTGANEGANGTLSWRATDGNASGGGDRAGSQ